MFNSEDKDKQGEFFNEYSDMSKKPRRANFNLGKIAVSLSYENILILTIGLIMLLIVCYSLGVERGKHLAQLKSEVIKLEQEQAQKTPTIKSPGPKTKKVKVKFAQAKDSPKILPYIQVASFRTDKYAGKEIERLKSKGYQPFVATWGKFRVVCVGGYKNKDEASEDLKQLRKVYADCILHNTQ